MMQREGPAFIVADTIEEARESFLAACRTGGYGPNGVEWAAKLDAGDPEAARQWEGWAPIPFPWPGRAMNRGLKARRFRSRIAILERRRNIMEKDGQKTDPRDRGRTSVHLVAGAPADLDIRDCTIEGDD